MRNFFEEYFESIVERSVARRFKNHASRLLQRKKDIADLKSRMWKFEHTRGFDEASLRQSINSLVESHEETKREIAILREDNVVSMKKEA